MTAVGLSSSHEIKFRSVQALVLSPVEQTFLLGVILVIATAALYYPVRHHPFSNYDDEVYVTQNNHVKYGLDWDTVKWAFTTLRMCAGTGSIKGPLMRNLC